MTKEEYIKKESEKRYRTTGARDTFSVAANKMAMHDRKTFSDGLSKGLEIAEGFYEFVQDFTLQELAEKTTAELLEIYLTENEMK